MMKDINLTWKADGIIDSYTIYRAEDESLDINTLPPPLIVGVTVKGYTDNYVGDATSLHYRVASVKGDRKKISEEYIVEIGEVCNCTSTLLTKPYEYEYIDYSHAKVVLKVNGVEYTSILQSISSIDFAQAVSALFANHEHLYNKISYSSDSSSGGSVYLENLTNECMSITVDAEIYSYGNYDYEVSDFTGPPYRIMNLLEKTDLCANEVQNT